MADEGDSRAKEVEKLISKQDTLISTLLVGSNLVNILASVLATSLFISLFGEIGVVLATFVMTALVVIFAEILPKMIALENSDRWSLKSSFLIKLTFIVLGPVAILSQRISRSFIKKNTSLEKLVDAHDEIRGQISIHHQEGEVKKGDRDMLGGILDLPDVNVEDVMVHRKNITALNIDEIDEKKIIEILSSPYSRIPVWEKSTDNFIGLLNIKSLIKESVESDDNLKNINIRKILSKPWFVPETTSLKEQLNAFLEKKLHMALVVDEYGSIMGLITLEDILEENQSVVYRPTLTGQGERVHLFSKNIGLETHIDDISNMIEYEDINNIILIGHSYGGMVITGVADKLPRRIKKLVYVDAFFPYNQESVFSINKRKPR